MKVILLFLGGSGAKCAEAFLHAGILSGAAGAQDSNVTIQIMDTDTSTPTQSKLAILPGGYSRLRAAVGDGSGSYGTEIHHRDTLGPHDGVAADQSSHLAALLGCQTRPENDILRLLLTEDMYGKGLRTGLYGWPNLGQAVWDHWLAQKGFPPKGEIEQALAQNETVRVVLVGSVFGGTGASGIPAMGKYLKKTFGKKPGFELHGLALTPYFAPPSGGPKAIIKAEDNPLRARHVLTVLSDADCGFDSLHFLGLPNPIALTAYKEDRQDNPTSAVERVAGWALWSLYCRSQAVPKGYRVLGVQDSDAYFLSNLPDGPSFEAAILRNAMAFAFLAYEYGEHWNQFPAPQSPAVLDDALNTYRNSLCAWLEGPCHHLLGKGERLPALSGMLTRDCERSRGWPELFNSLEASGALPWSIFIKSHPGCAFHADVKTAFHKIRNAIVA